MFQARQGDLLFVEVEKVKGKKADSPILAHGEMTGHCHMLSHGEHYIDGNDHYVTGQAVVVHDEHGPIPIEKNVRVIRQRQLDLSSLQVVQVVD